jgi:hypothetical protein
MLRRLGSVGDGGELPGSLRIENLGRGMSMEFNWPETSVALIGVSVLGMGIGLEDHCANSKGSNIAAT